MFEKNHAVRSAAKDAGVPLWAIAEGLHISEASMTRMLRKDLTREQEEKVLAMIKALSAQKGAKK